jgi:NAD(P)-dependent dehydrogenase (short-subunit alcohol dehydrogenase family)
MPLHILITGANRGIGLEMTRQAAQRGDRVIAACRHPDDAADLQKLAAEDGLQIDIIGMDVADDSAVAAAASQIASSITGALDLVVANAGQMNARGGLQDPGHTQDNIAASLMTNVAGVFFTARHFVPHLRAAASNGGTNNVAKLAVISSQMGSSTRAGISAPIYRASKAAATNLARSLSMELAADNIAVGAWHPGWVQTDMGGSEAAITPQTSAAGLLSRFDALSMQTTGVFEDYAGTPHPF